MDLSLRRIAIHAKLTGNHAKCLYVRFFVSKNGHAKIKIGDTPILFFKGKIGCDMSCSFREKWQMR